MPNYPQGRPEDRIREMKQMMLGAAHSPIPYEPPPVEQIQPDFPDMYEPQPPMELPSVAQINTPANGPYYSPGADKSERVKAALQHNLARARAQQAR